MIKSAMQLKAKIRNVSGGDSKVAMTMMRIFFMERFLERVSFSKYKEQFVLKGGMLVSSLLGIKTRATMDIDVTVQALPLKKDEIEKIITEICNIPLGDNVTFDITHIESIKMKDMWKQFKKKNYFVEDIAYEDTVEVVKVLLT